MSKFYFGGASGSVSSDDEDNLPYPEALPRSDFLAPTFSAPAYLSTLSDRHQTLEDLRSDLRERSQALSKELLDLVNTNYEQFLSLGSDLKGGEEKLLEVDERLEELEDRLMVASLGKTVDGSQEDSWSDSEDEDEEDEELAMDGAVGGTSTKKLQRLVVDCRRVEALTENIGKEHPFIVAQQSRIIRVRNTILLDLSTALKQTAVIGESGKTRLIKILSIYREFGASGDAVKVLKDLQSK
ncbi:oligomeric golgi complex component, COG2-domain-containing protein [Cadophora sp. MPI-SDFR-AT-0126]|nr:oligomeric golgi complex component, COG2-domain-containing protein [Leotiomycetes sp. MPI-SDFR-AT-0126]